MNKPHHPLVLFLASATALLSIQGHAQTVRAVEIRDFPANSRIVEGGDPLRVPIVLNRGSGSGGTVDIEVRPAQPRDMPYTDIRIADPNLGPDQTRTELTLRLAIGNRPLKRHSRRFVVRAEAGEVVSEKTLTVRVEPVDAPDIYLLAGQSNMVGSTLKAHEVTDPEDAKYGPLDAPHPRVKQLNVNFNTPADFQTLEDFRSLSNSLASPSFTLAIDPLHHSLRSGQSTKPDTTIGPGLSFGKKAVELTERDVILVPAAWGGSGFCKSSTNAIRSWNPEPRPESRFGGTGLFDRALVRVNYTIEQTGGILRGILWNQGRRDSYNDECARLYQENVIRLIEAFRSRIRQDRRGPVARGVDSDVPFIGATMSRGKDSRRDYSNPNAREIAVDGVYRNLSDTVPYTDYVNMHDIKPPRYPCGDGSCAHFGGRGYRIMGQRYFDALVRVFDRGGTGPGPGEDPPPLDRNRPSGLVSGALYRWDGRNWVYRPGNVCKYRGSTSDVPAANRLDGDRSGARYLALRAEISGRSIPDCPPDVRIDNGDPGGGDPGDGDPAGEDGSPSPPPSGGSDLVSGALYRWDGRNWVYRPGAVCKYRGSTSDVPAANRLDGDRTGARYLALRAEISGKSIPDCPPDVRIDNGDPGSGDPGSGDPGGGDSGGEDDSPSAPPSGGSDLVSGALYRWDGRNWVYRPGAVCKYRGSTSDVPAANRLDGDRTGARYLALRAEISGKSIPDCPSGTPVDAARDGESAGATDPTSGSVEDSALVPGTLYRWDGRNFLYGPDGTCRQPGPRSDVDPANDLDLDRGSARYAALRPAVKASGGRRCR